MARDDPRERSPRANSTSTRSYRDRSDYKRKHRETSEDVQPALKKIRAKQNEYPSVNELKRRIRDVKRLLNRVDLSADARVVQERALAGYERDLQDETDRRDRSKMIKKYHFVRFLDRKAATKDLNRLLRREKELSKSDSDSDSDSYKKELKSLTKKIHSARINLNYTIYYPLTEKYVALYADKKSKKNKSDEEEDQTKSTRELTLIDGEKPAIWHAVERCMGEGTLDDLRDGKLSSGFSKQEPATTKSNKTKNKSKTSEKKPENQPSKKTSDKKNRKSKHKDVERNTQTRNVPNNDDEEESDGGFFEE